MSEKRILVVEDDEDTFFAISQILRADGYLPLGASSNQFADLVLNRQNVDALILDLNLFDQSGTDLLQKIRANKEFASLPILIHTGRQLSEADKAELLEHATRVIIKGPDSLAKIVGELAELT